MDALAALREPRGAATERPLPRPCAAHPDDVVFSFTRARPGPPAGRIESIAEVGAIDEHTVRWDAFREVRLK